ncbi:MAG: putative cation transport regulator ChaB [Chroococcidiopsis cubana SAG 39.79]|uniref:ChaB family protein n=2 Tax=Chroococcidiopsis TaxID=54298 RepID=K9TW05_CHRTP|nr:MULTISPECIES: ChaB family protein [Chroococcidiopsis]MBD2308039.1 ChaB family protein [Chroococcidiopsis sp. [FACHB-1243]]PSB45136.1 cation transport regulator ChaB [Cyanosarcina cf. burmensis CCALA 770]AFY87017.1 ChaB family protein [Chroococcidiopsis thermalis PCC 7203]MDZ4874318.1 putative cation transport regulator ChaB [Chroococcidiopsis cubana SAG 39.79]PSB61306.1 cation transport regulator ChaB [Chroococcidiopsis cubana CCALA 043]
MAYNNVEELPAEITEKLPQHGQQIFLAAFNAAQSDGMSEDAATNVAWNSVSQEYEQGEDGQWHQKPEDPAVHDKSTVSGGN